MDRERYYESLCDAVEALYIIKRYGNHFYDDSLALMEVELDRECLRLEDASPDRPELVKIIQAGR